MTVLFGDETVGDGTTAHLTVPNTPVLFADWVSPHLAVMTAVAAREVGRADADDLVQEALLRGWRRRSTFDAERGSVKVWLLAILLDRIRRHRLRTVNRYRPVTTASETTSSDAANQSSSDSGLLDRLAVEGALRKLPPRQRQVVTLHYLADLSVAEVAVVLGIKTGTVKSHLFDARLVLRVILEEQ